MKKQLQWNVQLFQLLQSLSHTESWASGAPGGSGSWGSRLLLLAGNLTVDSCFEYLWSNSQVLEFCWIVFISIIIIDTEVEPGTSGEDSRPEVFQLTPLSGFSYNRRKLSRSSGTSSEPRLLVQLLKLASASLGSDLKKLLLERPFHQARFSPGDSWLSSLSPVPEEIIEKNFWFVWEKFWKMSSNS